MKTENFAYRHIGPRESDVKQILDAIGASSIEELIDFVVARILDQLDIEHELSKRWSGEEVK